MKPPKQTPPKYPLATIIGYGPDNQTATKLVVSIFKKPRQKDPDALHRWIVQGGNIRQDPTVMKEIVAFIKSHHAAQTVTYDRILGCPHEEGIDYLLGGTCPHCPFWENIDRFTHEPKTSASSDDPKQPQTGRNDPCPCGSGKKYKKCCGR